MKKVLTEKDKSEYIFTANLLSCAFGNSHSVDVPLNFDWESFFVYTKENNISNVISYVLDSLKIDVPERIHNIFTADRKFLLMKDASQFDATNKLIAEFERQGVDNLLVKGQFIKDIYPQPDYRNTCDVDIHIRAEDLPKAEKIANSLGYDTTVSAKNLAVVCMLPFVTFELHADNGEFRDTTFSDDVFSSARLISKTGHCFEFPVDNHYVYIIEHFAKHYRDLSGMGIRMVMDIYALYNAKKEFINFKYVNSKLKKAGIDKFHDVMLKKGKKYFSGKFQGDFDLVDIFIFSNGFMGSKENMTYNLKRNYENNNNGQSFIFRKIFPHKVDLLNDYPIVEKIPVSLPFVWLYRLGDILFGKSRKAHYQNIKDLKKYNNSFDFDYLNLVMKESGFKGTLK